VALQDCDIAANSLEEERHCDGKITFAKAAADGKIRNQHCRTKSAIYFARV